MGRLAGAVPGDRPHPVTIGHLPGGPYLANGRPNTARSDPTNVEHLAEPLRSRARQLIADCPYSLYVVSGLRDPGRQWDLRRDRVGYANIWNPRYRGNPTTAVPARWNKASGRWEGGSRHQTGEAVDFGGSEAGMQWWHDHREAYGIAKTVPGERWHGEADRRDIFTGRIHNNPTALIRPTKPPPPPPTPTPEDWLQMATEAEVRAMLREEIEAAKTKPYTLRAKAPGVGRVIGGSVWVVDPLALTAWRPASKAGLKSWRQTLDALAWVGAIDPTETEVPASYIASLRLVG